MNYIKCIRYLRDDQHNPIDSYIRRQLTSHFQQRRVECRTFRFRYQIIELVNEYAFTELAIRVESLIGGKPLIRTFAIRRVKPGAGRGLSGLAIRAAVASARGGSKAETGQLLTNCLHECVADIQLAIDRTMGLRAGSLDQAWQVVKIARLVVPLLGFVAILINAVVISGKIQAEDAEAAGLGFSLAGFGLFIAAIMFFLVHAIGIVLMPLRFFHETPTGRRTLMRVGVKSPLAAKLVALLVAIVLAGVVGAYFFLVSEFHREPAKKQALEGQSIEQTRLLCHLPHTGRCQRAS